MCIVFRECVPLKSTRKTKAPASNTPDPILLKRTMNLLSLFVSESARRFNTERQQWCEKRGFRKLCAFESWTYMLGKFEIFLIWALRQAFIDCDHMDCESMNGAKILFHSNQQCLQNPTNRKEKSSSPTRHFTKQTMLGYENTYFGYTKYSFANVLNDSMPVFTINR